LEKEDKDLELRRLGDKKIRTGLVLASKGKIRRS